MHQPDRSKISHSRTPTKTLTKYRSVLAYIGNTPIVAFSPEVPYLGFHWDMHNQAVHLHEEKKAKYLAVITEWEQRKKHNLLKIQKLYRKLLHVVLVTPAGQAHLTSLEAILTICSNGPFIPRSPP